MRVLIPVDHAVGVTGPHRNVVGSLNALSARRDVSVVLVTGRIDEAEPYAHAKNIDVRLGYEPHLPKRFFSNLKVLSEAARGCDLIYVPTNLKSLLYAQSVRFRRPIVAGPNVTRLPLPPTNRHDSPGKIELHLLSDTWFEPSRIRRDHIRRVSGVRSVGYIHHAIDLAKFSPSRRREGTWGSRGIRQDALTVLFVGRDNEARKGVRQLLDAAQLIAAGGRNDLQFALVGRMSSESVTRVDQMPNVHLLGFQTGNDLAELYASSDLFVAPSSWETFGFTMLEAMASGLPLIASRIGAFSEIVVDGESAELIDIVAPGSIFKSDAAKTLADAILALADAPDRRRSLGVSARQRAEEHFSEERLGNDLMALFCRVQAGLRGQALGKGYD